MGSISINTAVWLTVIGIILILIVTLVKIFDVDLLKLCLKGINKVVSLSGKTIYNQEQRYHRDLAVGKINEKQKRVQIYRFMNDLIIDLGLKKRGATPYEFLAFLLLISLLISLIGCQLLLDSVIMGLIMYPIVFSAVMCGFYTKANLAHDIRIEAVIESENIISNNIKDGVVVAVRNSIDLMPTAVRSEFRDFLDNIEHKNYHIRTALLELNNNLGSISDDFIKKCIVFEMEEEHGISGMFRDVVEINNIKTELRSDMKRKFEVVVGEFVLGSVMIFAFLIAILYIYPDVRTWYLKTVIGNIILGLDFLLLIGEFVFITYLRAREL